MDILKIFDFWPFWVYFSHMVARVSPGSYILEPHINFYAYYFQIFSSDEWHLGVTLCVEHDKAIKNTLSTVVFEYLQFFDFFTPIFEGGPDRWGSWLAKSFFKETQTVDYLHSFIRKIDILMNFCPKTILNELFSPKQNFSKNPKIALFRQILTFPKNMSNWL